jgi:hypothetical protein
MFDFPLIDRLSEFNPKLIPEFFRGYKNLGYHVRGVGVSFSKDVSDQEIERVIDGLGLGMGLVETEKKDMYKTLHKVYKHSNSLVETQPNDYEIEFTKTEEENLKVVQIFVKSFEKEKTGEHTVESLIQTVVTNLQEGFSAEIQNIRSLDKKELPSLAWEKKIIKYAFLAIYPLILLIIIAVVLPFFLRIINSLQ